MRIRALVSTAVALALAGMMSVVAAQGQTQGPPQGKPPEAGTQAKPATAASLAGKWTVSIESQNGAMQSALDLKADPNDAKKVAGTVASQMGETTLEGEVVDGQLTFWIAFGAGGGDMWITFVGTLQKDGSLAGTFDFGQGQLPWTAVREEPPTPTLTLAGPWTMTLEMEMGTATPTLEFVQEGESITGTYEGRYGKSALTGVLKNRALEFSFTMNAEGTDVVMSFFGEVAADFKTIVKGTADLAGMGEATWSAKRAEK